MIVKVAGLPTNIDFLSKLANHGAFRDGEVETHFIERYKNDLFLNPGDSVLAQEAYHAAKHGASIVAACVCQREHATAEKDIPGRLKIQLLFFIVLVTE